MIDQLKIEYDWLDYGIGEMEVIASLTYQSKAIIQKRDLKSDGLKGHVENRLKERLCHMIYPDYRHHRSEFMEALMQIKHGSCHVSTYEAIDKISELYFGKPMDEAIEIIMKENPQ